MSNKNKDGFTLIELLIAMSIISIIIIAFFTFINSSIRFNTKNENDIKALNIAQSEVENLREQIKNQKTEFKTIDNKEIKLNESTLPYKVQPSGDNHIYDVTIDLRCVDELYTIKVNVKSEKSYFSKKSTELITQVFGG